MDPVSSVGEQTTGRALVPYAPNTGPSSAADLQPRPSATFLAQLIAADRQLPQARARRRVEPREAITAYRAAQAIGGRTDRKS